MNFGIFLLTLIATQIYNFYVVEKIMKRKDNEFCQVFTPPGGGKTTLAADLVRKVMHDAEKDNKKVYSNVPIIGAYQLDITDIGKYELKDCVIIIDEAGSDLSNRNWQHNLNMQQIKTIKLHRHLNMDVWLFSQSYGDVDNKFRELTTGLYMLKSSIIPFRINAKAIRKDVDLINGQIVEFYEWDRSSFFHFWSVPNWAYFNTAQVDMILPKKFFTRYKKIDTNNK